MARELTIQIRLTEEDSECFAVDVRTVAVLMDHVCCRGAVLLRPSPRRRLDHVAG